LGGRSGIWSMLWRNRKPWGCVGHGPQNRPGASKDHPELFGTGSEEKTNAQ
jgi:hypothetical protein